ncbi:hypothetical protein [Rossellomorea aquimaris]|uniref:hypothetical protein n=1 Tax=Rossellomorea aquimaris TaxID=189382 RepID=UPI0007D05410|nr:hypothetical protein [Rossellomorea aquimaris]
MKLYTDITYKDRAAKLVMLMIIFLLMILILNYPVWIYGTSMIMMATSITYNIFMWKQGREYNR